MKRGSLVLSPEIEERWLTDVDLRQRKDLLMRKAVKAIEVGGSGGLISLWDKNRFVILVSIGSGNHGSCIVQLVRFPMSARKSQSSSCWFAGGVFNTVCLRSECSGYWNPLVTSLIFVLKKQKGLEASSKPTVHQSAQLRVVSLDRGLAAQPSLSNSQNSSSSPAQSSQEPPPSRVDVVNNGHTQQILDNGPGLSQEPSSIGADAINDTHTQQSSDNGLVSPSHSQSRSAHTQHSSMLPCNDNISNGIQQELSGWNSDVAASTSPNSVGNLHSSSSHSTSGTAGVSDEITTPLPGNNAVQETSTLNVHPMVTRNIEIYVLFLYCLAGIRRLQDCHRRSLVEGSGSSHNIVFKLKKTKVDLKLWNPFSGENFDKQITVLKKRIEDIVDLVIAFTRSKVENPPLVQHKLEAITFSLCRIAQKLCFAEIGLECSPGSSSDNVRVSSPASMDISKSLVEDEAINVLCMGNSLKETIYDSRHVGEACISGCRTSINQDVLETIQKVIPEVEIDGVENGTENSIDLEGNAIMNGPTWAATANGHEEALSVGESLIQTRMWIRVLEEPERIYFAWGFKTLS
ncbi:hypothetical protein V6N11_020757 [Hibiscus sabdariffa]|uniref:Uncharacterized protein n=1 Tax=Hibiscus sabdariffa TaxID=183260 RepID=A0ABR2Q9E0_9ROSI